MKIILRIEMLSYLILFSGNLLFAEYDVKKEEESIGSHEVKPIKKLYMDDAIEMLFDFYKTFISPNIGSRCSMLPSCSTFSRIAIEKHGIFIGLLMTFDRLLRCGHEFWLYEKTYDSTQFDALALNFRLLDKVVD